jgi:hypothetical protein
VQQELNTLPEHLSSPPVFSEVLVTRSLVLYVCFVDRLEVKTNQTSFLCGNRIEHHNTELRT